MPSVEPFVALSRDGKWMIVDNVAVAVDTLTVRGRLMPAGIQRQHSVFFPLDANRLWGKIKNDMSRTYVALVLKTLYLTTRSLGPKGKGQQRWMARWKPVLNVLSLAFAARMPAAATI